MQLVFNIIISCLLGALVVCSILLVIVQWMHLHAQKRIAETRRMDAASERLRMREMMIGKTEETRFGMPVKQCREEPVEKRAVTKDDQVELTAELRQLLYSALEACMPKVDEMQPKADEMQAKADEVQPKADDAQEHAILPPAQDILKDQFLELTKQLAIHEEELPGSIRRLLPGMEALCLGGGNQRKSAECFSDNELYSAKYYMEVLRERLNKE